jgi:multidrug transporter EmrE-like cation transporter
MTARALHGLVLFSGDMSVIYPLARGIATALTTIAAFVSLGEALSLAHLVAVGLISFCIMVLPLGAGASGVAVGHQLARITSDKT